MWSLDFHRHIPLATSSLRNRLLDSEMVMTVNVDDYLSRVTCWEHDILIKRFTKGQQHPAPLTVYLDERHRELQSTAFYIFNSLLWVSFTHIPSQCYCFFFVFSWVTCQYDYALLTIYYESPVNSIVSDWLFRRLRDLTVGALDHRSLPPEF